MCKASEKNERVQNVFSVYKVNDVRTVDTLPKCETVTLKNAVWIINQIPNR